VKIVLEELNLTG